MYQSRMSNGGSVMLSKREMKKSYKLLVRSLLNDAEKEFLFRCAKKYQRTRHLEIFFHELSDIINTEGKLRLLPYIRTVVFEYDKHDFDKFTNRLEHRMREVTTDFTRPRAKDVISVAPPVRSSVPNGRTDLRVIVIPHREDNLGFSIRGGSEHGLGIFVSEVDVGSSAAESGLEVGDQILEANNISLENAACSSAVRVLTVTDRLKLVVRRVGKIPEWKFAKEKVLWYDVHCAEIVAAPPIDPHAYHISGLDGVSLREKRVAIKTSTSTDFIGLNIRGGSEYGLGIYISRVDPGGLAEKNGICTGDQILDVNGSDFTKISHSTAADFLRTHNHLVFTLREVGRYPAFKELFAEYTWSENAGRKSDRLSVEESPIHRRHKALHKQTHNPSQAGRIPKAKSLSNLSVDDNGGIFSEIYLPKDRSSSSDIVSHQGDDSWKMMDFYDLTGKAHRSEPSLNGRHDDNSDLDFNEEHFVCLNGDSKMNGFASDSDSGRMKINNDRKSFPNTSKTVLENRLKKHYQTMQQVEVHEPRETILTRQDEPLVHQSVNSEQTHIKTRLEDSSNGRPVNFEEYIIPVDKLSATSLNSPYAEVDFTRSAATESFLESDTIGLQQNGVDEVEGTTVIITEVEEEQEPIYSKVNKVKVEHSQPGEVTLVSKGETTDGSITPEEEEVLNSLDSQIKMLEDRKSHLSSRAVSQLSPDGKEKKGTWSRIKSRLKGSMRLKKKKVPLVPPEMGPQGLVPNNNGTIDEHKKKVFDERAREILSDREYNEVTQMVSKYHETKDLEGLVNPLLKMLNNPEKMLLLKDIRGVVYQYHTARFDNMVNFYEIERYEDMSTKLHLPLRHKERAVGKPSKQLITTVLDENGHFHIRTVNQHQKDLHVEEKVLKKLRSQSSQDSPHPPQPIKAFGTSPQAIRAFGSSTQPISEPIRSASQTPSQATSRAPSRTPSNAPSVTPSLGEIKWVKLNHVVDQSKRNTIHQIFNNKDDMPDKNSKFEFVSKQKKTLGLQLRGGQVGRVTLPLRIDEIEPKGSAADNDNLKVGMIILSADGTSLVGHTREEAQNVLNEMFADKTSGYMRLHVKLY